MNESWGLQIFDESVETIVPQPRENGVTVFSLTNCKIAFNHAPFLEYVICLDERTNTWRKVYCVMEAEEFYKENNLKNEK